MKKRMFICLNLLLALTLVSSVIYLISNQHSNIGSNSNKELGNENISRGIAASTTFGGGLISSSDDDDEDEDESEDNNKKKKSKPDLMNMILMSQMMKGMGNSGGDPSMMLLMTGKDKMYERYQEHKMNMMFYKLLTDTINVDSNLGRDRRGRRYSTHLGPYMGDMGQGVIDPYMQSPIFNNMPRLFEFEQPYRGNSQYNQGGFNFSQQGMNRLI